MRTRVALGGSVLAAIAASLCCIGPLVALAFGLGTFGAAAAFEGLRPYLLGLTALLLAGAFYITYRKRQVMCEDGSCKIGRAGRASRVMLWVVTVAVVTLAAFPYYSAAWLKPNARQADSSAALSSADGA